MTELEEHRCIYCDFIMTVEVTAIDITCPQCSKAAVVIVDYKIPLTRIRNHETTIFWSDELIKPQNILLMKKYIPSFQSKSVKSLLDIVRKKEDIILTTVNYGVMLELKKKMGEVGIKVEFSYTIDETPQ